VLINYGSAVANFTQQSALATVVCALHLSPLLLAARLEAASLAFPSSITALEAYIRFGHLHHQQPFCPGRRGDAFLAIDLCIRYRW
jgi:hypothetical protein